MQCSTTVKVIYKSVYIAREMKVTKVIKTAS